MRRVIETLRRITKGENSLDEIEQDLRAIRSHLRSINMNEVEWTLYDMIVIQLDLLDSPDFGNFNHTVFDSIVCELDKELV